MKIYEEPKIEVLQLKVADVITTSGEIDEGELSENGTEIG